MNYRSDWPEIGLSSAISETAPAQESPPDWTDQRSVDGLLLKWAASRDRFESKLYSLPIWNLRLEVEDPRPDILNSGSGLRLRNALTSEMAGLAAAPPWGVSYVFSRVVESEPLCPALLENGFHEVERRCLYRTRVAEIAVPESSSDRSIRFASLAEIPQEQHQSCRSQIFEICAEAFRDRGYSRHFSDPFLSERVPGLEYIAAAMALNFERLPAESFLLAVDSGSERVCGFSVVGKKASMYTQLLSAIRRDYQGRDIYAGLTGLLARNLPPDTVLLNATHASNVAMQQAYRRSGRVHLADTIVLRRVFK